MDLKSIKKSLFYSFQIGRNMVVVTVFLSITEPNCIVFCSQSKGILSLQLEKKGILSLQLEKNHEWISLSVYRSFQVIPMTNKKTVLLSE